MSRLWKHYLKDNYMILSVLGLILAFSWRLDDGISGIAVILSCFLAYRINGEEKMRRNTDFFHALPITFKQKLWLKIVFPAAVIALCVLYYDVEQRDFHSSFKYVFSPLVTAGFYTWLSLVTSSLGYFVLCAFFGAILVSLLESTGLAPLGSCVFFALSVHQLAGGRLSKVKIATVTAVAGVLLSVTVSQIRGPKFTVTHDFDDEET